MAEKGGDRSKNSFRFFIFGKKQSPHPHPTTLFHTGEMCWFFRDGDWEKKKIREIKQDGGGSATTIHAQGSGGLGGSQNFSGGGLVFPVPGGGVPKHQPGEGRGKPKNFFTAFGGPKCQILPPSPAKSGLGGSLVHKFSAWGGWFSGWVGWGVPHPVPFHGHVWLERRLSPP